MKNHNVSIHEQFFLYVLKEKYPRQLCQPDLRHAGRHPHPAHVFEIHGRGGLWPGGFFHHAPGLVQPAGHGPHAHSCARNCSLPGRRDRCAELPTPVASTAAHLPCHRPTGWRRYVHVLRPHRAGVAQGANPAAA